ILARFRLELCDEDCALHATDASGASRSTPDVLCGGTVTTAPHPSERVSACRNNGAASWRRLKAGFARRKGYATSSVRGGVSENSPDQPETEGGGEHEAHEGQEMEANDVRAALREHSDHRRP